jgi:DNA-binding response OmpR family regulator
MKHKHKASILLVEDDISILQGLEKNLAFEGYQVILADNGEKAWELYQKKRPDLIVLDVMLPKINGFELCQMIKRIDADQAILFLSAKGEERDRITGLNLGADDYMVKPFSLRELVARVKAVLRRSLEAVKEEEIFRLGEVRVDFAGRSVCRQGRTLNLTTLEFDLLAYLLRNRGRALSREELLNKVWGYDYFGTARTIDNFITKLRSKIEDDPKKPKYILSLRGLGYKLEIPDSKELLS